MIMLFGYNLGGPVPGNVGNAVYDDERGDLVKDYKGSCYRGIVGYPFPMGQEGHKDFKCASCRNSRNHCVYFRVGRGWVPAQVFIHEFCGFVS